MINIFSSPRLNQLLPWLQIFIRDEVIPQEMRLLSMPFKEAEIVLNDLRARAKEIGLWAPFLRDEYGVSAMPLPAFAQLSEWMARTPFGHYIFNCQAPDIGNMELLDPQANPFQRARFLEPLINGEIRSCFSMTEPGRAGSNPLLMDTTAVEDGDEWVINGHKWFTTAADGARFAIVMAITDPEAPPHDRASLIIVPTDTPGFNLVRNIPVMGEAGEGYHSHGEIRYTNCRVPKNYLIGVRGGGFRLAQERLGPGRIHHCMRWIGIAERALELMCARAVSSGYTTACAGSASRNGPWS